MQEVAEFRINEKFADRLFGPNEGRRLGTSIRRILLPTCDARFQKVGDLQRELVRRNEFFFAGWDIHRRYTAAEIKRAKLFHLVIRAVVEPHGEACGTQYDYSSACSVCRSGRVQRSNLVLDFRKIPKTFDIASSIDSEEWIVSHRLAELMTDSGLTGFAFQPVCHKVHHISDSVTLRSLNAGQELIRKAQEVGIRENSSEFFVWLNRNEQKELADRAWAEHGEKCGPARMRPREKWRAWYQLMVTSEPVSTCSPTQFGIDPFDLDPEGEYRCPQGHVSGHNLLSELFVKACDWDGSDVTRTKNRVHFPKGVMQCNPTSMLLISPRFYELLKKNRIRGWKADMAHLI